MSVLRCFRLFVCVVFSCSHYDGEWSSYIHFHFVQSSAIVHSEDAVKTGILYKFLSEASQVFKDVYPIM